MPPDIADALTAAMVADVPRLNQHIAEHMATPAPWNTIFDRPQFVPTTGQQWPQDIEWIRIADEARADLLSPIHENTTARTTPAAGIETLAGEPLRVAVPPVRPTIVERPIATEPNRLRTTCRQRPLSTKTRESIAECCRPFPTATREWPYGSYNPNGVVHREHQNPFREEQAQGEWRPITREQLHGANPGDIEIRRINDPADPANEQLWARRRNPDRTDPRTATEARGAWQQMRERDQLQRAQLRHTQREIDDTYARLQVQGAGNTYEMWGGADALRNIAAMRAADYQGALGGVPAMLGGDNGLGAANMGGAIPPARAGEGGRGADNANPGFIRRMLGF